MVNTHLEQAINYKGANVMVNIFPMPGKVLVKKVEVQQESSGILLNNETEKFLSCGEITKDQMIFISDPSINRPDAEVHQVPIRAGDRIYFQKSKVYDTHESEYQVVNVTDIIYIEKAQ